MKNYSPQEYQKSVIVKRSLEMTDPQKRCLSWFLGKPPIALEDNWVSWEDWKKVRSEIDLGTASDLINLFKSNKHESAIAQIKQLLSNT